MGKYSHITRRLNHVPVRDEKIQERIDFVKSKILGAGGDWQLQRSKFITEIEEAAARFVEAVSLAQRDGERDMNPEVRTLDDFAAMYAAVRVAHDRMHDIMKSFDYTLAAYKQIAMDALESKGLSSVRFADGASVSTHDEPYAVVTDKEALMAWIRANDLEGMLSINWQTLNAHVKEALLNDEPEPDGVTTYVNTKLVFRRARN